jgi:hypothetical protein
LTGNEVPETKKKMNNYRIKANPVKLLTGNVTDKFPVVMDGGKTIVFISDKSKEQETRDRYAQRKNSLEITYFHGYSRKAKTT